MSQESPEQQMPLALSPTALAQRDANTMPTEYPKSIGKKTLDARYARDARRLPETPTHWISARDDEGLSRLSLDADAAAHKLTFPRRALRRVPRRFRSPTDSNMSPASKFVNAKKGGKKSSHGCVRARANHPRPSDARRRLAFREGRKQKTDAFALPLRLRLDSQMHAFAVGGQLQARGGAEWAWGVPIRRAPLPIRRAEVGEGSGADSSRTFEKIYSRLIDSSAPGTRASS
jgi:hypothetical protein